MADQHIAIHYQHMEEWLNDRKAVFGRKHKKEFASLLDIAPRLVQLIQYDVPALQKQLKKSSAAVEECQRVREEAERVIDNLMQKREQTLEVYDLTADAKVNAMQPMDMSAVIDSRIEQAFVALTGRLQSFARAHLGTFKECYETVLIEASADYFSGGVFDLHFPWLSRLLTECELPAHGEHAESHEEVDAAPQIDWGDVDANTSAPAVEIKWDATEGEVHVADDEEQQLPAGNGKTFSLDVSRGKDRTQLFTELRAALCFSVERSLGKDTQLDGFAAVMEDLLSYLTSSIDAEFVRMRSNLRVRTAFEENITRFGRSIAAAQARIVQNDIRRRESQEDLSKMEPQLNALLEEARQIRDDCMSLLQTMFPGRTLMIVGDINKYI